MALPKKHRRLKFSWPEYLGLGLLAVFFLAVAFTLPKLDQMNWNRTTARVIGVSVHHDNRTAHSPIGNTNNGVTVLYQYDTGTGLVTSEWSSNWLNTPILNRTAPTLINAAKELEVVDMNAVAESANLARLVSTSNRPVEITDPRVGAPEVSRTIRGEDFYGVLAERRKALSGVTPEMITAEEVEGLLSNFDVSAMITGQPEPVLAAAPAISRFVPETPKVIQKAMELKVRFDPRNPHVSALDYPGFNLHLPVLLLDIALAFLLLRYFAHTYPRLKLEGN